MKKMKTIEQIMENEKNNETIVAFRIGMGGRFNNQGFVSFIGEKNINDFTDSLFINFKNQFAIFDKIKGHENLEKKYYECCENKDFSFFKEKFNFNAGELIYVDLNGNTVGLDAENDGTGTINIDNDYDTTTAIKLKDLTEEDWKNLIASNTYKSTYLQSIID